LTEETTVPFTARPAEAEIRLGRLVLRPCIGLDNAVTSRLGD